MDTTRLGAAISAQISKMGVIDNLAESNFSLDGLPFNIKNDGQTAVDLEVNLWDMTLGTYVETRFEVGWNPEIVREVKHNATANMSLKWGA